MRYKVETIDNFESEAKRLIKKYHSLKNEIATLITKMESNPFLGTSLGGNCYKIRLSVASKGKGKSGGVRIITCVKFINNTVYLISIFDKSERENILDKELKALINQFK